MVRVGLFQRVGPVIRIMFVYNLFLQILIDGGIKKMTNMTNITIKPKDYFVINVVYSPKTVRVASTKLVIKESGATFEHSLG